MKTFYLNKTYKATTTKGNTYKIQKEINEDLGYGCIDLSVFHNHNIGTMVFNCINLKIAKKHPIYKQGNNLYLSQEYIKHLLNCNDSDFERNEIGHNYKFTDIFWDENGTALNDDFSVFAGQFDSAGELPTHVKSAIYIPVSIGSNIQHHGLAVRAWFAVLMSASEQPCSISRFTGIVWICVLQFLKQFRRTMFVQEVIVLIEFFIIHLGNESLEHHFRRENYGEGIYDYPWIAHAVFCRCPFRRR